MKPDLSWLEAKVAACSCRTKRKDGSHAKAGSIRAIADRMTNSEGGRLDPSAISRIFLGQREPMLHEVRQLATLLGVPMGELIRALGQPFEKRDNVP